MKKKRTIYKFIQFSLIILLLNSCMLGPDYKRPSIETPSSWRFEEKQVKDVVNTSWWEQFKDPVLNELIQTALQENKDLKIAAARVEEFLGYYQTTRGLLFPQIAVDSIAERKRMSERGVFPLPTTLENPSNNFEIYLRSNWEIDLWGKLRRSTEAARAEFISHEEGRRSLILTLVTSIAAAYINLLNLDKQLDIAKHIAKLREESYNLFKQRYNEGVLSELELTQAKSEYEQALSLIPFFEKSIAQQENALCILIGWNPRPIPRGKTIDELNLPEVPAGLPSDLLINRPDILKAEQELIAANAKIGIAKSLYFPSINLTELMGRESTELSELFSGPAKIWNTAGHLSEPIFTGGVIQGKVKSAEALRKQALFKYQQTIQTAFKEVEDALIDQSRSKEQLIILGELVNSLREAERLARIKFDNGYTSYIEVIDAERHLLNAELAYTQVKGSLFQALINLYKAMGGGWVVKADQLVTTK